jgi:hypothetical protein
VSLGGVSLGGVSLGGVSLGAVSLDAASSGAAPGWRTSRYPFIVSPFQHGPLTFERRSRARGARQQAEAPRPDEYSLVKGTAWPAPAGCDLRCPRSAGACTVKVMGRSGTWSRRFLLDGLGRVARRENLGNPGRPLCPRRYRGFPSTRGCTQESTIFAGRGDGPQPDRRLPQRARKAIRKSGKNRQNRNLFTDAATVAPPTHDHETGPPEMTAIWCYSGQSWRRPSPSGRRFPRSRVVHASIWHLRPMILPDAPGPSSGAGVYRGLSGFIESLSLVISGNIRRSGHRVGGFGAFDP